jgi:transposase
MFIKSIIKTDKQTGKKYQYYRLCESFRIGNNTRHRNILSLGKLEELSTDSDRKMLADRIEQLLNNTSGLFDNEIPAVVEKLAIDFAGVLRRKAAEEVSTLGQVTTHDEVSDYERIDMQSIRHEDVREMGAEWMCKQAIDELDIAGFLRDRGFDEEQINTCLMHIASRAVYPASEHKTAQWIGDNSAVAELFGKEPTRVSRHMLYKAAVDLYELKDELEKHLSVKTNELFDLDDKIILYDLTNTYFEGRKAHSSIAQFGRSKEKRSDCKLVVLALVTNGEGFVKYSRFFSGNTTDCTTLTDILTTLDSYTGTRDRKPIIALDAGIATEDNLALLKEKEYHYVCVSRAKLKDYQLAGGDPIQLHDNRDNPIEIRMVDKKEEGEDTFLYVHSQQKAVKEAAMKRHYNGHIETQLTALKASVGKKGGVKKYEKVMQRIGRIKQRYAKAAQYYNITVTQDNGTASDVTWEIIAKKNMPEDGVYFLRTSLQKTDERTLWKIYNTLSELEASFRTLKTDLNLRPIFHKLDKTTEAHLFLGILAYSLVASIRYRLKAKKINHDWRNIVRIMNTQKVVVTTMKNEKKQTILIKACSQPRAQVLEIYTALKYKPMPYHRKKFVLPQDGT